MVPTRWNLEYGNVPLEKKTVYNRYIVELIRLLIPSSSPPTHFFQVEIDQPSPLHPLHRVSYIGTTTLISLSPGEAEDVTMDELPTRLLLTNVVLQSIINNKKTNNKATRDKL